ncbi:tripartite tricarboxylate transporter substrate binding protein [Piscinibacter sakaiensis]|uniref:Putative exported protein n=1 Tax=Piscinibacter sakaiensis TaxID=1547922 RepID=A0A0K8NVA2_PISS1|nr:tripartite tricarboxylate transporter substrate binding protein [Piscinibacter sakaiensis]GAP34326.1 putative exported protein [Piscinibacter sakaiensis]
MRLTSFIRAAATVAFAAVATAAAAQPGPTKPIRLIVPFPPGGNVDLSARILAPELAKELGQTIFIENKAGAGGTVGLDAVAKSAPDGSTLGIASPVNHLAAPSLYPKLPYDSIKDFTPIGLIASVPMVLVVGPSSPVQNVKELIARAKARDGAMTMASAGSGSGNHIVGELFQDATGTRLIHVPYKGSAPANTDLAGGHVDLHFDQLSSVLTLVQGGRLKALAVTTAKRSPQLPDVPTLAESGVTNFDFSTTLGLVLPGKASPDLVARFSASLEAVLRKPAVREQFAKLGAEVRESSPAEYAAFIRAEIARTARIVREAKITLD